MAQLVGALREQLSDRVIEPLDLVLLAADRIQEALDDAVARGRVTRADANELAAELLRRGREQTDDVLGNLDALLGRGIDQIEAVARRLEETTRERRAGSVDRLMQSADRARRAVGVGPAFPILGYDQLSLVRIRARLGDLGPAELRTVREYEAAHRNRRPVLVALDRALG
jgi:polyhydroxyalkanoate synthesis regulator phasin